MSTVYQLSSSRFPANSGLGASLYGGRWNMVGAEAIYTAQSPSLAALEVLVHYSVLPQDFLLTEVVIPAGVGVLRYEAAELPVGWDLEAPTSITQEIGEAWVRTGRFAVLSVPSSIIPKEHICVLNPAHPDFRAVTFERSVPFRFDPRLK